MNRIPIRHQIALWTALTTAVALGAFAAGTLFSLSFRQTAAVDQELAEEAQELASLFARHPGEQVVWDHHAHLGWRLIGADGTPVQPGARLSDAVAATARASSRPVTVTEGSTRWRTGVYVLPEGRLILAMDLAAAEDVVHDLLVSYAWALPLVVVLSTVGAYWVARRSLAPVQALISSAEAIQANRLGQRVPVPAAEDELRRLATVINAMLARLDAGLAHAKRFAADASHELRTPLTIMRGETDRVLREPGLSPAVERGLLSLQEEIVRLDRITEQLLLLTRFDAGQTVLERHSLDYSALVVEVCDDAAMLAAAHGLTLRTAVEPGIHVQGDALHLRRLLLNLLDNATKYNHPGGMVECSLVCTGPACVWRVANSGPGILPADRPHVFDRFHRRGLAPVGRPGHGLGLSLCREIAAAHGGELKLLPANPGEPTVFELTLPSEPAEAPAPV